MDNNANHHEKLLLSDLPPETQHHILSFITSDHHKRIIRLVSQTWSQYINYNEFNIGLLLGSETDEFFRCFSRYEKPIGLKFMKLSHLFNRNSPPNAKLITKNQLRRAIENLTQLTSLDLSLQDFKVPKQLTNLQQLTVVDKIADKAFLASLSHLTSLSAPTLHIATRFPPNLEKLNCDTIVITDGKSLELNTRLTSLTTSCYDPDLIQALPNLRKLRRGSIGAADEEMDKEMAAFLPYLEELSTSRFHRDWEFKCLTTLQVICLDSHPPITMTSKLAKLKSLKCHRIDLEDVDMNVMQSLESCMIRDDNCAMKVLSKINSEKITQLTIKATEDNFSEFAKFTNLVAMKLTLTSKIEPYPVPLTALTNLILLYDTCPTQWMAGLPNLADLSIEAVSNTFNEQLDFEELQKLTVLRMSGCYDRINVMNLTNLLELEISSLLKRPPMIEIHGLSTLTNLTRLIFIANNKSYQALKNWTDLASLTKLRQLSVKSEPEPGDGSKLTPLQNLTRLEYSTNNVQSLECLTKLTRLQKLVVQSDEQEYIQQNIIPKLLHCYY